MKNILKYMVCLLLPAFFSCESWLDVKPADRISGRALFETREGFTKALNGVYMELTNRSIYGREMTAGMLDLMGQYYAAGSGVNNYYDCIKRYNYEDANYGVKSNFSNLWNKTYNLIVNLNIIIEECGDSNHALDGIWFGLIKGEALALRAFMHLDMLRIFGPTHSKDPKGKYIPYVTNSDQAVSPLLSSEEFREYLMRDLTEAVALLGNSDPIIENGVMNSDASDGNNALRYRQYRMNYYAARALLARAYLWFGDTGNAYETASELLDDIGETTFPFVEESIVTRGENPDRLFHTEIMFSLYDNYRTESVYNALFSPSLDPQNQYRLAYEGNDIWSGRIEQLFVTQNDLRYRAWFKTYSTSTLTVHYVCKYEGVANVNYTSGTGATIRTVAYRNMISLIRLGEVYLIAAECAPDLDTAKDYLSKLRIARKAYDLTADNWQEMLENIEWEYRREFLGEGQMFYFYKRHAKNSIPAGEYHSVTENIGMGTAQYVVPLPDSEANERIGK